MWRYEFDSHGGYDCLSAAYRIYQGDVERFKLDTKDFPGFDDSDWTTRENPSKEAEAVAEFIVGQLNSKEGNIL